MFLKDYKCTKKKLIQHIIYDLESSSDDYDDSEEEYNKSMGLMFLENGNVIFSKCIFEGAILKMSFMW